MTSNTHNMKLPSHRLRSIRATAGKSSTRNYGRPRHPRRGANYTRSLPYTHVDSAYIVGTSSRSILQPRPIPASSTATKSHCFSSSSTTIPSFLPERMLLPRALNQNLNLLFLNRSLKPPINQPNNSKHKPLRARSNPLKEMYQTRTQTQSL